MRFLIDAQLPPALARRIRELGHEAEHVVDLGLRAASDTVVWQCAVSRSATLISKDGDFVAMRGLRPGGPSVIWIRIGNTTRDILLKRIAVAWPDILAGLERGESVIEVA
jgi:predicted nuclease of predicted toxin-antitoxin system